MHFPPVTVTIPATDAYELKVVLVNTFGDFKVTDILPAAEKVVLYVEFGEVLDTNATKTMRDSLLSSGEVTHGRFTLTAQLF